MFGLVQPGLFVVFDDATASPDMIWTRCWSQHRTDVLFGQDSSPLAKRGEI